MIHSTAFRRLKHKTQVFVYHEGDHFRTRLTHSIEVAQVARSLARALFLDEDLAEVVALAHDLGHPPFGHAGEDALDACMEGHGGFDHNAQSLRIVACLERRYADYDGLNLCWETVEGIVKHNGPLVNPAGRPVGAREVPETILAYDAQHGLRLETHPSLEAQVAAIADDIAYDAHDIDDGLRAAMFDLDQVRQVPLLADLLADIDSKHPGLERSRLIHELVRRIITVLIEDVIACTSAQLRSIAPTSVEEIRTAGRALATFSSDLAAEERGLKQFLFDNMYRHARVEEIRSRAKGILHDLFRRYLDDPEALPPDWRVSVDPTAPSQFARHVCDFIAGMTDRYAISEHRRLFDATPDLR